MGLAMSQRLALCPALKPISQIRRTFLMRAKAWYIFLSLGADPECPGGGGGGGGGDVVMVVGMG